MCWSKAKPWLPYLLLYVGMLVFHLSLNYIPGDAVYYGVQLAHPFDIAGIWAFMKDEYLTWSSRVLCNSLVCVITAAPVWVWRLLDPAMIALTAWLIAYMVKQEQSLSGSALVCVLVFLYQWPYLASAGWAVTTVTYLWSLTFVLLGLLGLMNTLRGRDVPVWQWCVCSIALCFGSNMEQAAVLAVLFLITGSAAVWRGHKRVPVWIWVQLGLVLAMLLVAFTCPGNALRTEGDIASYYIDYPMLSLLKKIEIGVSGAIAANVYGRDSVFYLFAVLSAVALWEKKAPWLARLMGLLPCVLLLPLSIFRYQTRQIVPQVEYLSGAYSGSGFITFANSGLPLGYLPLLVGYGLFLLCLLNVLAAFGFSKVTACVWGLLAAGGITQSAIGFTPSAGVSSGRTGLFFSFCIIAASAVIWQALVKQHRLNRSSWIAVLTPTAVLCLIQFVSLYEMC